MPCLGYSLTTVSVNDYRVGHKGCPNTVMLPTGSPSRPTLSANNFLLVLEVVDANGISCAATAWPQSWCDLAVGWTPSQNRWASGLSHTADALPSVVAEPATGAV